MNVTFGLIAAWIAVCLGAAGVKGKAPGYSLGATIGQLLRGNWAYSGSGSQTGPSPAFQPSTPANPGGLDTVPLPAGPGINPGGPFQLPAAGSAQAATPGQVTI